MSPTSPPSHARAAPGRRLHVGAEVTGDGAHFRVWAPESRGVEVVIEDGADARHRLHAEDDGYFSGSIDALAPGACYRYLLDGKVLVADPASRFQPQGPHGPSQLVDPGAFHWSDAGWCGCEPADAVIYELHVGTFTPAGTWQSAAAELPYLAELGVRVIEVMPVADFAGDFGWGYDGACLFAPYHRYGTPEHMRAFVDRAHRLGLAVILDVVYNHFAPEGNMLAAITPLYRGRHRSEWGDAPNFDGKQAQPVRALYACNPGYWIDEFHLDGLRVDATQQIFDHSGEHILRPMLRTARAAGRGRRLLLTAENEPQDSLLLRPQDAGGIGFDALWNDDFHHAARVAATGRAEAYYSDYRGSAQELLSALRHGFLFQGQYSAWQRQRRGSPARGLPPHAFVHFLENHDQVANSLDGRRLHQLAAPAQLRALTALLLLGPQVPLLFQGQEYGSSRPFHYFADHPPELATAVAAGRAQFVAQFPSIAAAHRQEPPRPPHDPSLFAASTLDHAERMQPGHAEVLRLFTDLLRLRQADPTLARARRNGCDGAVLGPDCLLLRLRGDAGDDRLLLVNLGAAARRRSIAEPLLAPPGGGGWRRCWHSEDTAYGGSGLPEHDEREGWLLPAQAALLYAPSEPC